MTAHLRIEAAAQLVEVDIECPLSKIVKVVSSSVLFEDIYI